VSSVNHIFHISGALDHSQRIRLQSVISQHDSVHSASFDRRRKQFIALAYDPDEVSADELKALFRQNGVLANPLNY